MSIPRAQLEQLKMFVSVLKQKPDLLHTSELAFFKDYLEAMGATLPEKKEEQKKEETKEDEKAEPMEAEAEPEADPESEESEVELDMEGVIDSDNDPPQDMGDPSKIELSEAEMDAFDAKRGEAMSTLGEGEWAKASDLFTEAIKINSTSAAMFAKRGNCYIKLKKPNACIRDCTRAIELNPDNASAYKFRGRANRLLGNFAEAARDLRLACKIDFDDTADEWLKEVTPNAKKIEEHDRAKERKRSERELVEKKEKIRKAKEARAKAAEEAKSNPMMDDDEGGMPGGMGGMGGLGGLLNDPELMANLSDPEVAKAFQDIMANPANLMKYQSNPKVMALLQKMTSKMGGGGGMPGMGGGGGRPGMGGGMPGGMGGMPGMAGFPGMGGMFGGGDGGDPEPTAESAPSSSTSAPAPPKPATTDDLD